MKEDGGRRRSKERIINSLGKIRKKGVKENVGKEREKKEMKGRWRRVAKLGKEHRLGNSKDEGLRENEGQAREVMEGRWLNGGDY